MRTVLIYLQPFFNLLSELKTGPIIQSDKNNRKSETPIVKQCQLLGIKRGKVYHIPHISQRKQELLNRIDELYTENPTRGQRRMRFALRNEFGLEVGRDSIRSAMKGLNIEAIYPKKKLSPESAAQKVSLPAIVTGTAVLYCPGDFQPP